MGAFVANLAVAAAVVLLGVSTLLFAVGLLSYWRLRHGRLLWVGLAFLFMAVQGAVLTWLTFRDRAGIADGESSWPVLALVNLAIVLALYASVLKS